MMKLEKGNCSTCIHARVGGCLAYPNGIPYEIAEGIEAHHKVREDQEGEHVYKQGTVDMEVFFGFDDLKNSPSPNMHKKR